MLDLKFVRDNLDVVRKALQDKGETAAVDRFSELIPDGVICCGKWNSLKINATLFRRK